MEWWHVYLFTRLDGINSFICGITVVSGVCSLCFGVCWGFVYAQTQDPNSSASWKEGWMPYLALWQRFCKSTVPIFLTGCILSVAIPTQKEAAAIYLLPKLARSDFAKEAQQLPTEAAKLMRLKLESWIADMEPKK